ncbi:MAG: hypothetical protein M3O28_09020 [Actinomycetota bacterium]|nr:hypothetical protein [Actinomycetota bacterium]
MQPEVGEFRQGSEASRWALARYLVGRALAESLSRSLIGLALAMFALAAALEWGAHSTFWAVLVAVVGLATLAMRAILGAVLRRLTTMGRPGAGDNRLSTLLADTRRDVLRELRRLGLPGRTWTLPLLVLRFAGAHRRSDALTRLRRFDLARVVPAARLDELHLLLLGDIRLLGDINGQPRS